jgi:ribosomal-protein-alanine N-acetyltransferase
MLTHIGTQKIETDRLILRKFKILDAKKMFENWASDPENIKYLSWQAHKNVFETQKIIAEWILNYDKKDYYRWAITLKNSGELIGGIDVILLLPHIDCAEFGYVLSKKFWNQGIMTESLKAVLKFMFEKVNCHRIQARHDIKNPASGRVMAKTGMKFEGVLREADKSNVGEWVDCAMHSILRSEI